MEAKGAGNMNRRYQITSPIRFVAFLVIAMLLVISATIIVNGSDRGNESAEPAYIEIRIQSGDTLWDLAKEYGPSDEDVRKVVKRICKINGIVPEGLMPGQKIKIPSRL
jgi:hypothetical protein